MQLRSIEYVEFESKLREWRLKGFCIGGVRLIVGMNATGKSRTLRLIRELGNLLAGDKKLQWESGDYRVKFEDGAKKISYRLKYEKSEVIYEILKIEKEEMLKRGKSGRGKILATKIGARGEKIDFQVAKSEIAVVSKKDKLQHPFLERLNFWGKSMRYYDFGEAMGQKALTVVREGDIEAQLNLKDTNNVVRMFRKGVERYPKRFAQVINRDMAAIGYKLEEIRIAAFGRAVVGGVPSPVMGFTVKEEDIDFGIHQGNVSKGMFRALSLIIQLNYSELFSVPSCILIDDIGEGLDYDRSTNLIKLSIAKAKRSGTQLIMATNDHFVMNNVPLENWSIITRCKRGAKVYDYMNAKKAFEEFKFTGLSNFDFFTSRFYEEGSGSK